jgi:tetratricopeptide (TPR) repeat protein
MRRVGQALLRILLLGGAVLVASPVRAEPWTAEDIVARAREAARVDHHKSSIAAFRRAIELAPERRTEWLPELADQLTWDERYAESIPLYREALEKAATPEDARRARLGLALALSWDDQQRAALAEYDDLLAQDPGDREARLGRARVLSWMDRQGPAKAEYERVLQDDPTDLDALRGLGRVQSWRGRQRDASQRMEALLQDHPHDQEATAILAESLDWMGRPDRSERVLRDQLAADPSDSRAASLLDDLEFAQRPRIAVDWRESHQSDHLRITSTSVESEFSFGDGRTVAGPSLDLDSFRPDSGPVDQILVSRPGLHLAHRFDDTFAWTGNAFVDVIDTQGASGDHVTPTYDTWFTILPNDVLRFDVGSSRSTFDNEKSLRKGITATYAKASMDVMPDELTRFTTRVNWGHYSDGNSRPWWQFETERRIWNHPRVSTGFRYTGFNFARSEQASGYYNPNTYHSNEVLLRASDTLGEKLRWYLGGSAGWEITNPGRDKAIWSAGASLAYPITKSLEIETAYDFFSSRTAASGGFERGTGRLSLRHVF